MLNNCYDKVGKSHASQHHKIHFCKCILSNLLKFYLLHYHNKDNCLSLDLNKLRMNNDMISKLKHLLDCISHTHIHNMSLLIHCILLMNSIIFSLQDRNLCMKDYPRMIHNLNGIAGKFHCWKDRHKSQPYNCTNHQLHYAL
jgi:hypothetical protein